MGPQGRSAQASPAGASEGRAASTAANGAGGADNKADDQPKDRPDAPTRRGANTHPTCGERQGTRPHWERVHTPILSDPRSRRETQWLMVDKPLPTSRRRDGLSGLMGTVTVGPAGYVRRCSG